MLEYNNVVLGQEPKRDREQILKCTSIGNASDSF